MSLGRKGCCWEQRSKEERTLKCPLAERAVTGSNVRKGERTPNVQGQIRLSLGATFDRGKDTEMFIGR
jgi:hypothetical protein